MGHSARLVVAMRERPLFSPTRRPPKVVAAPRPAPPASKPVSQPPPPLSIVGTAVGDNESLGVFVDQNTKRIIRLRIGVGYQSWTLQAMKGRDAILQQDQCEVTLALPAADGKEQPASVALTAPGGKQQQPASSCRLNWQTKRITSPSSPPPV